VLAILKDSFMTIPTFDRFPTVNFLEKLIKIPGTLDRNLPQALRLWVMLRSIYGDDGHLLSSPLNDKFTHADWRKLFSPNSHKSKTLREWLFDPAYGVNATEWRSSFQQNYKSTSNADLNLLLDEQLFAVNDKTLKNHLNSLQEKEWLTVLPHDGNGSKGKIYSKVDSFPTTYNESRQSDAVTIGTNSFIENCIFTSEDLADFVSDFIQSTNQSQRFLFNIDYIVPGHLCDRINELRDKLKQIWHQEIISPIQITYDSRRAGKSSDYLVYPVCVCYYQRAPYLFAFGQTPTVPDGFGWYDYRLDRIKHLKELKWPDDRSSNEYLARLQKECSDKTPEYVLDEMKEAIGFEFFKPLAAMLIRFERKFYIDYIKGTERSLTFPSMSLPQIKHFVLQASLDPDEYRKRLLSNLETNFQDYVYCKTNYRVGDNNVIMRLRAWGLKVEVLLPLDLRKRMTDDLRDTWKLYAEDS
jgi:CRISPR-associated protein (TIGR03985 family)